MLGPVSASTQEGPLALGGLKQRAVFTLLALNAGRVVSLDRLVDELWSDEPPARATLSLQSYVARLRRVLAGATPPGQEVTIVTRPPGWVLTLDPRDVDVTRFEAMVAAARRHLAGHEPVDVAAGADLLEEALGLWSGAALSGLEGLRFAQAESTRLTDLRLAATELLFQARLDLGDTDSVAERAGQFVTAFPFRERAWAALILALYRCGRQSEALAAAAALRRSLVEELGVDPSPEIRALEERILRQDPALAAPVVDVAGLREIADESARGVEGAPRGQPHSRLVGRDDVLSAVESIVARAETGGGGLIALEAPAGLGKSSILRMVESRVRAGGGAVLRGDCVGVEAAPALWPWVSIVRSIASVMSQPATGGEAPGRERAMAAANAALTLLQIDGPFDPSLARDPATSRRRLFRAVIDALRELRQVQPVAVIVDDLHWADKETIALLSLAVDELVEEGVVFAVAIRSSEPGADNAQDMVQRIRREWVWRLALEPLGGAEIAALVEGITGAPPTADVVSVIRSRTAGNPLFVCELVRLLASEHRLDLEGVSATLPNEVRDVLQRRLHRLPQQTVTLLTVIAVAGGPTDLDLLAGVTGLDADSILDACESALLAGLLLDAPERPGHFVLSHDLVRQTLEQSLSTARLLRMHAKIAAALQPCPPSPQRVVDLARHLTAAAPLVGPAAAVPHLVDASGDALSRNANDQAEHHLRTALDLVSRIEIASQREALEGPVRSRLTFLQLTVRGEVGFDDGGARKTSYSPPTDDESAVTWLGDMIRLTVTGESQRYAVLADAAIRSDLTPVALFCALFVSGFANYLLGRHAVALVSLEALEPLIADGVDVHIAGFFDGAVAAASQSALAAHTRGDEALADDWLARATQRAGPSDQALMVVAQHRTWLAAMRGDAWGARLAAADAHALAQRLDYLLYGHASDLIGGWADTQLGEPAGVDRAVAAWDHFRATGLRMFASFYLLLLAEASAAAGRLDDARRLIEESQSARAETGEECPSPRLVSWATSFARPPS